MSHGRGKRVSNGWLHSKTLWGIEHGYEDGTFAHAEDATAPVAAVAAATAVEAAAAALKPAGPRKEGSGGGGGGGSGGGGFLRGLLRRRPGKVENAEPQAAAPSDFVNDVTANAAAAGLTARLEEVASKTLSKDDLRAMYPHAYRPQKARLP